MKIILNKYKKIKGVQLAVLCNVKLVGKMCMSQLNMAYIFIYMYQVFLYWALIRNISYIICFYRKIHLNIKNLRQLNSWKWKRFRDLNNLMKNKIFIISFKSSKPMSRLSHSFRSFFFNKWGMVSHFLTLVFISDCLLNF